MGLRDATTMLLLRIADGIEAADRFVRGHRRCAYDGRWAPRPHWYRARPFCDRHCVQKWELSKVRSEEDRAREAGA